MENKQIEIIADNLLSELGAELWPIKREELIRIIKIGIPEAPDNRDWEEDFHLESGNYRNMCKKCLIGFTGLKHRRYCKACSESVLEAPDKIPSATEYYFSIMEVGKIPVNPEMWLEFAESYALLREQRAVEQAKEKWEKESNKSNPIISSECLEGWETNNYCHLKGVCKKCI